ncbi:MAG: 4-hydroxybenzoate octaprenyltransferase [Alphaproteobacteria bacterium]|nr:4-hydroxybenzoate octaprenyltransferase [Alphaproteobacteria bacterium]
MKTLDAPVRHWTDALPPKAAALAQLSRWDRPVGWRLLFLPCLMGVAIVRIEDGFWPQDAFLAALFLIGAVAMRGAGCAFNDLVDHDVDAKVARTAARPLPSGRISRREAWAWLLAQCLVGLAVLAALPPLAQAVALCALPLVAAYPFMKRITWWPQAWLGLTFSWGALVGAAASDTTTILPEAWLLYAGCVAWTIAYDTLYALQDKDDDALIGVRSTARLFGDHWKAWTFAFYILALFFWAAAAAFAGAGVWTMAGLGLIGALIIYPLANRVDPMAPMTALNGFKANQTVGLAVLIALSADPLFRTMT